MTEGKLHELEDTQAKIRSKLGALQQLVDSRRVMRDEKSKVGESIKRIQQERRELFEKSGREEEQNHQLIDQNQQREMALKAMSAGLKHMRVVELEGAVEGLGAQLALAESDSDEATALRGELQLLEDQRLQTATFENQAARVSFDMETDRREIASLTSAIAAQKQEARGLKAKETSLADQAARLSAEDEKLSVEGARIVDEIIRLGEWENTYRRALDDRLSGRPVLAQYTKRGVWQRAGDAVSQGAEAQRLLAGKQSRGMSQDWAARNGAPPGRVRRAPASTAGRSNSMPTSHAATWAGGGYSLGPPSHPPHPHPHRGHGIGPPPGFGDRDLRDPRSIPSNALRALPVNVHVPPRQQRVDLAKARPERKRDEEIRYSGTSISDAARTLGGAQGQGQGPPQGLGPAGIWAGAGTPIRPPRASKAPGPLAHDSPPWSVFGGQQLFGEAVTPAPAPTPYKLPGPSLNEVNAPRPAAQQSLFKPAPSPRTDTDHMAPNGAFSQATRPPDSQ